MNDQNRATAQNYAAADAANDPSKATEPGPVAKPSQAEGDRETIDAALGETSTTGTANGGSRGGMSEVF